MSKFIKPPMLSTSFSQSGRSAKKRFENILNRKPKKAGLIAFSGILLAVVISSSFMSLGNKSIGIIGGADGSTAIYVTDSRGLLSAEQVYKAKLKYVGDASGVGRILGFMPRINGAEHKGMELKTTEEPYGIIQNFTGTTEDERGLQGRAAVILCLIENADWINFVFDDKTYSYSREQLDKLYEMPLAEYSKELESFEKLYDTALGEINTEKLTAAAILNENVHEYAMGECAGEGHIILGTEEKDGSTIVYALTTYGEYGFENGAFIECSGTGIIPVRLTFDKDFQLTEYKETSDGSLYDSSLREMFPSKYYLRARGYNSDDLELCKEQEKVYARAYLKSINHEAFIGMYGDIEHNLVDMNVEVSNALLQKYSEYPYWIGTLEKIEDGVRYVYEKSWENIGGAGNGIVTFRKYEYDTNKTVQKIIIEVNGSNMKYLDEEM